jgi:hypothetical protein
MGLGSGREELVSAFSAGEFFRPDPPAAVGRGDVVLVVPYPIGAVTTGIASRAGRYEVGHVVVLRVVVEMVDR